VRDGPAEVAGEARFLPLSLDLGGMMVVITVQE